MFCRALFSCWSFIPSVPHWLQLARNSWPWGAFVNLHSCPSYYKHQRRAIVIIIYLILVVIRRKPSISLGPLVFILLCMHFWTYKCWNFKLIIIIFSIITVIIIITECRHLSSHILNNGPLESCLDASSADFTTSFQFHKKHMARPWIR